MATLTITTTAAQAQRVATAFGARLGLGRDATAAEIKADVIAFMRAVVQDQEWRAAVAAQQASAQEFTPT